WKTLFKDVTFTKKHIAQTAAAEREGKILAVVLINCKLHLMSVNVHNKIVPLGNLVSLNYSDKLDVTRVYHCDSLLLCITEDYTRLVIWNPYSGETRWICVELPTHHQSLLDVTPDWTMSWHICGVSLKGNTYWYAEDKDSRENITDFLLCFDFTAERFAPPALFQNCDSREMEIWVTSKIAPNAASWSKFFALDMLPLTRFPFYSGGSFLIIDEEKKAVVVFDECQTNRNTAYFIGANGCFSQVDLGSNLKRDRDIHLPHVTSYVPSSVQINQPA
ncbi:hypothetical protein EUTSA_v10027355mg, partial [Eutrema salsugineum]